MQARSQLAILHHNANVGKKQAVVRCQTEKSMAEGSDRFKMAWKKQTSSWVVRTTYEQSKSDHLKPLLCRVMQVASRTTDITPHLPQKPAAKNIAKEGAPNKSQMITKHKSRF